jgi:hypothetical protein
LWRKALLCAALISAKKIAANALYQRPITYYEWDLPHWQPEHAALFLTWRLRGSLRHHCVAFPAVSRSQRGVLLNPAPSSRRRRFLLGANLPKSLYNSVVVPKLEIAVEVFA